MTGHVSAPLAQTGRVRPLSGRSLFITCLGIGQICSWGSLYYSFPLIAEAMGHDLGWSKPHLFGAATLGLALGGVAAFPVGAAIDKGHGRLVMTAGSVLAGLCLVAWSQVQQLWMFYLLMAAVGVLQAATLYEPAFAVVARRAGATGARAGITALTLWGGFASTVFIPLIQTLLEGVGWRGALVVLGLVNLAVYLAQARFAAEVAGLDIAFERLSVYDVARLGETFDIVLFMGVLYHLRHPLLALDLIRTHVAGELLVFQSMLRGSREVEAPREDNDFWTTRPFDAPAYPKLHFVEHRYAGDPTNWWVPNRACVEAMLRSSGFEIVGHPEEEVYLCRTAGAPGGEGAVYPSRGEQA